MEPCRKGAVIITLLVATLELRGIVCAEAELRLIRDLMTDYDPDVRPCEKLREAVQVTIDITLHQIIEVDAKNQLITTSVWQRMYWKDEHLRWNPSNYSGLDKIRLSAERIWRPDITLVNDISDDNDDSRNDYPASVLSDGSVQWLTPRLLTSSCTMDMVYFPWDNQTCTLEFTSWTYDNSELLLAGNGTEADTTGYVQNGEWRLERLPVRTYTYNAPCCPVPFTSVEFHIQIRRRAKYYVANLIFPSVLITAAGMLVFCLPPESGEKVSLSVTILLATTVYQLLLADRMPVQSISTPIIGRYIIITQILLGLSTTLTTLVLDIHHQGVFGHEVPHRLRKIVKVMATVLLFKGTVKRVWRSRTDNQNNSIHGRSAENSTQREAKTNPSFGIGQGGPGRGDTFPTVDRSGSKGGPTPTPNDYVDAGHELQAVSAANTHISHLTRILSGFDKTLREKEEEDARKLEWMLVAKMFDRIFLVAFSVCFTLCSLALLTGGSGH